MKPQVATKLMVKPNTIETAVFLVLQRLHLKNNLPIYPILLI
jgi:hypothetical protein